MTILDQIFSDVPEVYLYLLEKELNCQCLFKITPSVFTAHNKAVVFVHLFDWQASLMGFDFWVGIYEELKYMEENKVKK